jgi:hypothetical protein
MNFCVFPARWQDGLAARPAVVFARGCVPMDDPGCWQWVTGEEIIQSIQHAHLTMMMRGHYAYYGISGNIKRLRWYAYQEP